MVGWNPSPSVVVGGFVAVGVDSLALVVVGGGFACFQLLQPSWSPARSPHRLPLVRRFVFPCLLASLTLLLPPPFALLRAHIPLERGGAAEATSSLLRENRSVLREPTSLNRGEGLVVGLMGEVGGGEGEGKGVVERWWWRE